MTKAGHGGQTTAGRDSMITYDDIKKTRPERIIFVEYNSFTRLYRIYDNIYPAQTIAYFDLGQENRVFELTAEYARNHEYTKIIIDI